MATKKKAAACKHAETEDVVVMTAEGPETVSVECKACGKHKAVGSDEWT